MKGGGAALAGLAPLALTLALGPASAQTVFLSEDAFRAWTEGRVIRTDFGDGTPFGIEDFRRGDRVVWGNVDGTCLTGHWRSEGGSICYHYDGRDEPSCLRYQQDGATLVGYQWDNDDGPLGFAGMIVRLTPVDSPPLACAPQPVS